MSLSVRLYWSRWADALRAFHDNTHDTWVVVEDFHPISLRVVARFNAYEDAAAWLQHHRRGVMRIWTLAEYRRRIVAEAESEKHWIDLAYLSSTAWRTRSENQVREAEYFAAVAKRDPFAETGSMPIITGQ